MTSYKCPRATASCWLRLVYLEISNNICKLFHSETSPAQFSYATRGWGGIICFCTYSSRGTSFPKGDSTCTKCHIRKDKTESEIPEIVCSMSYNVRSFKCSCYNGNSITLLSLNQQQQTTAIGSVFKWYNLNNTHQGII